MQARCRRLQQCSTCDLISTTLHMAARGLWLAALFVGLPVCNCLNNGLGLKPPLGFNTWNYFGCSIDEQVLLTAADRLVSLGLADVGYTYLNLDDCWHTQTRAADSNLQADPIKFPAGMKALADAVHAKGLNFGIYSDAGMFTCAGYPGSRFHEEADAALFASWGVDYLKYDNCWAPDFDVQERYTLMRDALNRTGRPIYFSMCNWGLSSPWQWGKHVGNSWRTDADIAPDWSSILRALDNGAAGLAKYAEPGGWNDPDMLEVGIGSLSLAQQRSHFALWALVKAPLLIGADLANIAEDSLAILKAKEVIAINQDDLGVAGDIIFKEGPVEVWAGPLSNNHRAVILFNRHIGGEPTLINVTWAQLGYTCDIQQVYSSGTTGYSRGPLVDSAGFKAAVRDLYAEQGLGVFDDGFETEVGAHDVAVLRVMPVTQPAVAFAAAAVASAGSERSLSNSQFSMLGVFCSSGCLAQHVHVHNRPSAHVVWGLSRLVPGRVVRWLCQCAELHRAIAGSGMQQQQQQQVTWRPWHDATARKVQKEKRTAAKAHRAAMHKLNLPCRGAGAQRNEQLWGCRSGRREFTPTL